MHVQYSGSNVFDANIVDLDHNIPQVKRSRYHRSILQSDGETEGVSHRIQARLI